MFKRFAENIFSNPDFGRQMRFIAGPRQVGKTTMVLNFLQDKGCNSLYYNWDLIETRSNYRSNPYFFFNDVPKNKKDIWLCFDEIHKINKWKNILKGHFDKTEKKIKTIVTGSARLDLFRRSGDSLAGRYFLFHLLPVTLSELADKNPFYKDMGLNSLDFIEKRLDHKETEYNLLEELTIFSGFPEPLSKGKKNFHTIWQKNYIDRIVNEDIRDLTNIKDLNKIEELIEILPNKIGSPLSVNSLREDLEINHSTVKNYLRSLELAYVIFFVKPYTAKISRSIKKESKTYLYDWSRITDLGARFENYIACELKNLTTSFNDSGLGTADIFFIKTKDGKETDFLITRDKIPWLLIETKLASNDIRTHHINQAKTLGDIPLVQITKEKNIIKKIDENAFIVSANKFF